MNTLPAVEGPAPRPVPFIPLAVGCVVTAAGVVFSNGNLLLALLGPAVCLLVYFVSKLPLRTSVLCLLFLLWTADYLPENPQSGLWESPLYPVGRFLFLNLSTLTGIGALRFPGFDLLLAILCGVACFRRATGSTLDGPLTHAPRSITEVLAIELVAVVGLDAWGVATGGSFDESLWQLRQWLLMPLATFLFLHAFRGEEGELRLVARVAIAAACVKAAVGIVFWYFVARTSGREVEFTTSHSDTLLFVPLLAGQVALLLEEPTSRNWGHALKWAPWVTWALVLNDRRLGYVSLVFCFVAIVATGRWTATKRSVLRKLVLIAPVLTLYTAAGWSSHNPVFGPAQLVRSLIQGDPAQAGADYRDIENFNLLSTWKSNALLPLGFGHKFEEPVKLPDISFIMPTYQFHPHNSVLWAWAIGGVLGFTALFAPVVACVYWAARAYRFAQKTWEKAFALTAICVVICYLNQCYGDMGNRTYFGSMGIALCLALVGKLAVRVEAQRATVSP